MTDLVIGMGEIGKAVAAVVQADYTYDISNPSDELPATADVMHICFPYSEKFISIVLDYILQIVPDHIIIYSTLPIGTTSNIPLAVHSPVEGKHPDLELSVRTMVRWLGSNNGEELAFFYNYFYGKGIKSKRVNNSSFTEALKLISTTEYGVNIVFASYKAMIADSIDMPYELTQEWNREYNRLYRELGMEKRFQKFVLDRPVGPIGGHCVVPNAELLGEQFPNEMLKMIKAMK